MVSVVVAIMFNMSPVAIIQSPVQFNDIESCRTYIESPEAGEHFMYSTPVPGVVAELQCRNTLGVGDEV